MNTPIIGLGPYAEQGIRDLVGGSVIQIPASLTDYTVRRDLASNSTVLLANPDTALTIEVSDGVDWDNVGDGDVVNPFPAPRPGATFTIFNMGSNAVDVSVNTGAYGWTGGTTGVIAPYGRAVLTYLGLTQDTETWSLNGDLVLEAAAPDVE